MSSGTGISTTQLAQAASTNAVDVVESVLDTQHFTQSGKKQFVETVRDYADQLLSKSVHHGEIDKADGLDAEITHDHVRASSHSISASFGKPPVKNWLVPVNVFEYLATAAAGVGGGHLDTPWGIATFGIGISVAVVLVVIRLTFGGGGNG